MHPLIIGGVGLAAILGILWASSGTAGAKQTNTKKNVAAGGAAYAAGKAAGFAMGGIDAASGFENLNPEDDSTMIAQSKTSDDPVAFLKGVPEGYAAGYAGGIAAKKIGMTYAASAEDVPPPPPEPPAAPAGKPKSYVEDPNGAGYSTAYGSGYTYGRKNSFENAPGSGNANALKTSDSYGARKKFDEAQMTLWSSSWDKGYQDGWDAGQVAYHEGVGGGGTTESGAEPMLKVGGLLSVGHDSKTGNVLDVGGLMSVGHDSKTIDVGGLLSVGYDSRTGDVLKVGNILSVGYDPKTGTVLKVGSLLSVGHEPSTGTVLKVAGMRVLGIRRAYRAPIVTSTRRRPPGAIAVPIQEDWHVPHNN